VAPESNKRHNSAGRSWKSSTHQMRNRQLFSWCLKVCSTTIP